MNFYVFKSNQKYGPYSVDQIQFLLKQGMMSSSDLVWAEGWEAWTPIKDVSALSPVYLNPTPNEAKNYEGERSAPVNVNQPQENLLKNVKKTVDASFFIPLYILRTLLRTHPTQVNVDTPQKGLLNTGKKIVDLLILIPVVILVAFLLVVLLAHKY
jgi:hypothetical protein